jgi:hypothetical protein
MRKNAESRGPKYAWITAFRGAEVCVDNYRAFRKRINEIEASAILFNGLAAQ